MIKKVLSLLALIVLVPNMDAFAHPAQQHNPQVNSAPPYSMAEYNDYTAASQNKNPEQRLAALNVFVDRYPHSGLLLFAYETFYSTYFELKNYPKTLQYVDSLLMLGNKPDPAAQLRALATRVRAFELLSTSANTNQQSDWQHARDAALHAIEILDKISKPENVSEEQFAQEKKTTRAFYEYALGYADLGLKEYKDAVLHLQFATSVNDKDPVTFLQLGVADLRMTPPAYLDGFWALAHSVALKGANVTQTRAYLRDQLLRYQQCSCDSLIDDEENELIKKAEIQPTRSTDFNIPSAEDLQKVRESAGPIVEDLRTNDAHGQQVWLADCGLEFPEVSVKVITATKEGDAVVLKAFRSPNLEEMERATEPNLEIRLVGQPGVERLKAGDWVHFHGTLTALRREPFLLIWEKAQVNPLDIPPEVAKKQRTRSIREQHN